MMKQQPRFEAKFYYNLSLDRLVPDDHLLRLIANAVDFSFIRPLCRPFYSHKGRPSVDPVVLFKMLLIGYLYGITSERRLARELSLNLGYRWFLGYDFDQCSTTSRLVVTSSGVSAPLSVYSDFDAHANLGGLIPGFRKLVACSFNFRQPICTREQPA